MAAPILLTYASRVKKYRIVRATTQESIYREDFDGRMLLGVGV